MKNSTFAQRLRAGLDVRQMTQAELSQRSKISKSSISHYLKGDWEGKQDAVYSLAQVLDVSEAWLMGYDVPMEADHPIATTAAPIPPGFSPMPKMHKVPLIGSIACGTPITAEQNLVGQVDVPEEIRCDFCLYCKGDSMSGAGIHDGDAVYIRRQPEVENGEIAAVRIGEEATLKRVYYTDSTLTLMPANPVYAPMVYTGQQLEDVQIEGRVVGWTHWVK